MSESHINAAVRGSYFLAHYELRITWRCLEEDFEVSLAAPIGDLLDHPIVKALIKDRATDPNAGKTVGPEAGEVTRSVDLATGTTTGARHGGMASSGWYGSAPTTASITQERRTIRSRNTSPS